ncbi:MAG: carboxypeptidase-like regulatory domain-containing protein, partial [Bacteroidota bacterium]
MKLKNLCFVLFLVIAGQAMGQVVTGVVSTEDGPLPGATVILKGTQIGVVTDFDGKYTLEKVNTGDVLVFSYVGYKQREITYSGQNEINVELYEDLVSLDEVVIVNYGTQKNTPVSVVDAEDLSEFPTTDIGQALQGRA